MSATVPRPASPRSVRATTCLQNAQTTVIEAPARNSTDAPQFGQGPPATGIARSMPQRGCEWGPLYPAAGVDRVPPHAMNLSQLTNGLAMAAAYTGIGLVAFAVAFWIIVKVTPFSIRKEIEEDQNIALGIVIAAVFIGIAMIISAAVHG